MKKLRNKSHLQAIMWSAFPSLLWNTNTNTATNTKRERSDDPCESALVQWWEKRTPFLTGGNLQKDRALGRAVMSQHQLWGKEVRSERIRLD